MALHLELITNQNQILSLVFRRNQHFFFKFDSTFGFPGEGHAWPSQELDFCEYCEESVCTCMSGVGYNYNKSIVSVTVKRSPVEQPESDRVGWKDKRDKERHARETLAPNHHKPRERKNVYKGGVSRKDGKILIGQMGAGSHKGDGPMVAFTVGIGYALCKYLAQTVIYDNLILMGSQIYQNGGFSLALQRARNAFMHALNGNGFYYCPFMHMCQKVMPHFHKRASKSGAERRIGKAHAKKKGGYGLCDKKVSQCGEHYHLDDEQDGEDQYSFKQVRFKGIEQEGEEKKVDNLVPFGSVSTEPRGCQKLNDPVVANVFKTTQEQHKNNIKEWKQDKAELKKDPDVIARRKVMPVEGKDQPQCPKGLHCRQIGCQLAHAQHDFYVRDDVVYLGYNVGREIKDDSGREVKRNELEVIAQSIDSESEAEEGDEGDEGDDEGDEGDEGDDDELPPPLPLRPPPECGPGCLCLQCLFAVDNSNIGGLGYVWPAGVNLAPAVVQPVNGRVGARMNVRGVIRAAALPRLRRGVVAPPQPPVLQPVAPQLLIPAPNPLLFPPIGFPPFIPVGAAAAGPVAFRYLYLITPPRALSWTRTAFNWICRRLPFVYENDKRVVDVGDVRLRTRRLTQPAFSFGCTADGAIGDGPEYVNPDARFVERDFLPKEFRSVVEVPVYLDLIEWLTDTTNNRVQDLHSRKVIMEDEGGFLKAQSTLYQATSQVMHTFVLAPRDHLPYKRADLNAYNFSLLYVAQRLLVHHILVQNSMPTKITVNFHRKDP